MSMLALMLASCGSTASSAPKEKPSILFGSPAVNGRVIPAHYRCSTRAVWLPLKWGALPLHTQELALYVVRFGAPKVANSGQVKAEVKAEALVLGLHPTLRELTRGKYPRGALIAIHARRGEALSICPPKGVAENLLFRIYALGSKLHLTKASKVNPLVKVTRDALEAGTFIALYRPA
jgi:phosphatidylethanolamine-binding protein (PEBP) family uncharacterized protein